jgi:hypothetical protein
MDFYQNNLSYLKKYHISLADDLDAVSPDNLYEVVPSRQGPPTLSKQLQTGQRITLHSSYDPIQEASRFIEKCDVEKTQYFIVLGAGLGYHLRELVAQAGNFSRIIVIEKDMEIFRLALKHVDWRPLLEDERIALHIDVPVSSLIEMISRKSLDFLSVGYKTIVIPPLTYQNADYYDDVLSELNSLFKETQVELGTQSAFSRKFYSNIIDNWQNILTTPGIHDLKNKLVRKPALIVSAGPSLDKNIALLKNAVGKALILSVDTAFTPLMQAGIRPDFAIAIDPDISTNKAFPQEMNGPKPCLVFDPCVPVSVPNRFKNKRMLDSDVSLSRWIAKYYEEKGSLGKSFSVAHTAFLFAQHLGCRPIIFTGQDFSFHSKRLHCSGSMHSETHLDLIDSSQTRNIVEDKRLKSFASSLENAKDIFGQDTQTTLALATYKNCFVENIQDPGNVFNATEGGVPMQGICNLTLRELLMHHCTKTISFPDDFHNGHSFNNKTSRTAILQELKSLHNLYADLLKRLEDVKAPHDLSAPLALEDKEIFVTTMKNTLQFLGEKPEAMQLLQGYAYAEFLQWRVAEKASLANAGQPEEELLQKEFDRDRIFLPALIESTEFLGRSFERMIEITKNI